MTDDDTELEPWSTDSAAALAASVRDLLAGIEAHAHVIAGLRGGSSEVMTLFAANDRIRDLVTAWNGAVSDHTGTTALLLDDVESWDEDLDDDAVADEVGLDDGDRLSVVSRWDFEVTDVETLVTAGREAHRRNRPSETEADAQVAVPNAAMALYSILHEAGEPWYRLPGVDVIQGTRLFLRPSNPDQLREPDPGADVPSVWDDVRAPEGELLFTESWS